MQIDLSSIVVTLAIFGLIWWLATTYIPMPEPVRKVINVVCVVFLIIWLLQFAGFGRVFWIR